MNYFKHHVWLQILTGLVLVAALFVIPQVLTVTQAHNSLAGYAQFRGCQTMTSVSDATATCNLYGGQSITMVQINNKWYLAGDGPVCYFGNKYCW